MEKGFDGFHKFRVCLNSLGKKTIHESHEMDFWGMYGFILISTSTGHQWQGLPAIQRRGMHVEALIRL